MLITKDNMNLEVKDRIVKDGHRKGQVLKAIHMEMVDKRKRGRLRRRWINGVKSLNSKVEEQEKAVQDWERRREVTVSLKDQKHLL